MRKVHTLKIDLEVHNYRLPINSTIVQFCENGHGELCIWYVFTDPFSNDSAIQYTDRNLHIYGTGHDIPMDMIYVATAICGRLVWHLFEKTPMVTTELCEDDPRIDR